MRCAIAEALVAAELTESLFVDLYAPPPETPAAAVSGPGALARAVLDWLASSRLQTEATVVRCQLAQALVSLRGGDYAKRYANEAAGRICAVLSPWLPEGDGRMRFEADLATKLEDAVELWTPLQRADKLVRAKADIASRDWLFDDRNESYDHAGPPAEGTDGSRGGGHADQPMHGDAEFPLAILFPSVYVGEEMLFPGKCVFPSQGAVASAKLEQMRQHDPRANRASRRWSSSYNHHQQMGGQPAKEARRTSISSVDGSRSRGPFTGISGLSDLSVRKPPPQIDGKGTEISSTGSTRSRRSENDANRR